MKWTFRSVLFWLHLAAGLGAGLIIAIMSATGVAVAFQPQLLERAERASRTVVPADRLPMGQLLERAGKGLSSITIHADPAAAVRVVQTGGHVAFLDPSSGQVRPSSGEGTRSFLQWAIAWHRWLGRDGEGRAWGKAITGACNAAFLFLGLTGLYLWWPRRWNAQSLRVSLWFRRGLTAKARDFNWHNVIGFWCLPVLVVVTASGMMISYRWATKLVYGVFGESPPAAKSEPKSKVEGQVDLDAALALVAREAPDWKTATIRLPVTSPRLSVAVKRRDAWPRFDTLTLTVNTQTNTVEARDSYAHWTPGRRLRTWLRYLHTGEALGWVGQLVAAVAATGALVLMWTGWALAYRRLRPRRARSTPPKEGDSPSLPVD